MSSLANKTILLIISGGIAAYKSLELIRLLRKEGAMIVPVLTEGGLQFVTPLSVSALAEHPVYTDLWSLKDESEMGHIRLSREADLIVIAPATANLLAKMAHGLADDLASTTVLASNKPIIVAPAMNHAMWDNAATQRNIATLRNDGIQFIDPTHGDMACGETGIGRMAEPTDILNHICQFLNAVKPLAGKTALVTSGPTYEPIDPVRFIGNRSSGKQGHAIAAALAAAGADVTLITGPVSIKDPAYVTTIHVETAADMLLAATNTMPADIVVCAAAVSDWTVQDTQHHKIKKRAGGDAPTLTLQETPDILATLAQHQNRAALVIGFAAETENLVPYAQAKLLKKGCDWVVANEVGKTAFPVFGADHNHVTLITRTTTEEWPTLTKQGVAERLVENIISFFEKGHTQHDTNTRKICSAGE